MKRIASKTILNSFFNIANFFIVSITLVLSAIADAQRSSIIILGGILFFFSTMYAFFFSKQNKSLHEDSDPTEIDELAYEKHDNLTPVLKKLVKAMERLKQKSKDNPRFLMVSNFMDDVCNFEQMIPKLVNNYRKGKEFLKGRIYQTTTEISNLESKIAASSGTAKETYASSLEQKKQVLKEIEEIKSSLAECESKLHYMLSTLQQVETIVESSSLKNEISNQDIDNINVQLDVFSESMKDVMNIMKI